MLVISYNTFGYLLIVLGFIIALILVVWAARKIKLAGGKPIIIPNFLNDDIWKLDFDHNDSAFA